ncbi:hypothetical protein [Flavobacterium sp.]|uniref:hypothetical protein n=1 Tax=Flavobacterium sp. TaxID=239 RepID=UPI0038FC24D7
MNKIRWINVVCSSILISCLLTSCNSTVNKKNEAVSQAVYAIHDGFQKSRYDIAFRYSVELVRLVPPPDKKIEVKPIKVPVKSQPKSGELKEAKVNPTKNIIVDITGRYFSTPETSLGENLVILPEIAANKIVVVENSLEFNKLLEENKELKNQIIKEKKENEKFSGRVDTVIKEESNIIQKAANSKKDWFGGLFSGLKWGFEIFSILGIAGVIAVCIFFPAAIPLLINIFTSLFSVITSVGNSLLKWINKGFTK